MSLMKQCEMMTKCNPKMAVKKSSWKKYSEKFRSILKANKRLKFNSGGYGSSDVRGGRTVRIIEVVLKVFKE